VETNEIYPQYDTSMCKLLKALQTVPLIAATNAHRGTQLKLGLLVEGNQTVFFKPAWYNRDKIIDGPVYSGKDRHNSEILAFYLGALLNLRWTPIVVGRAINLKEVWSIGNVELQESMTVQRKFVI
jgi:glycosaminoglycan xylosylkinase